MLEFIDKKFDEISIIIVVLIIALTITYSVNRMTSDYPWGWIRGDGIDCIDARQSYSLPANSRKIYCPKVKFESLEE